MTKRQPKGTPVGGQFAEGRKPEGEELPVTGDLHLGSGFTTKGTVHHTAFVSALKGGQSTEDDEDFGPKEEIRTCVNCETHYATPANAGPAAWRCPWCASTDYVSD